MNGAGGFIVPLAEVPRLLRARPDKEIVWRATNGWADLVHQCIISMQKNDRFPMDIEVTLSGSEIAFRPRADIRNGVPC
jgi:hypothetical protein